ncbi:DUF5750 family protein [uncultured Methanobrevibacter sp.]|uniref:DUF5750 family protein n=1 Tax=uncultured Methanobrevibacter sp. TaxID=253161 RepID=UPI002618908C|nr:DUF5750 family protein [uncultured Methanobrevibacter sp.]
MDVNILDYGLNDKQGFIIYKISGLSQKQLNFIDNNLEDETHVEDGELILKTLFEKEFFPFKSNESKIKNDDFILREELEMNLFLSSFLEDMV